MTIRWLLAAVHLLALGVGLGAVWARGRALEVSLDVPALRRVFYADAWWGIAAVLWIGTGLVRAFGGYEKGAFYYLHNHLFWAKMGLLAAISHGSASSKPYSWCSWSWRPRRWRAGTACRRNEVNCSPILERVPCPMCRNIKRLRHPDHAPTDAELHDAALQFVRKISGFHAPSKANEAAFNTAVHDVAAAGRVLFRSLHVRGHADATA